MDLIDRSETYFNSYTTFVQNKSNNELVTDHCELVSSLFESLLLTCVRHEEAADQDRSITCQNSPPGIGARLSVCDTTNSVDFRYGGPFIDPEEAAPNNTLRPNVAWSDIRDRLAVSRKNNVGAPYRYY